MTVAWSAASVSGGQPSAPAYVTKVSLTVEDTDEYETGGIPVPVALGSSWQAAVGAGKTILGAVAFGRVTSTGAPDGYSWNVNLESDALECFWCGGAAAAEAEVTNKTAYGADITIDVLIFSI